MEIASQKFELDLIQIKFLARAALVGCVFWLYTVNRWGTLFPGIKELTQIVWLHSKKSRTYITHHTIQDFRSDKILWSWHVENNLVCMWSYCDCCPLKCFSLLIQVFWDALKSTFLFWSRNSTRKNVLSSHRRHCD